ncbi:MAG: NADP-dependent oxidoreductase [Rhodobacteraceae bacterium]|nr:NADP-dependent oxidoreductase [Paracoccaceae bacterium]
MTDMMQRIVLAARPQGTPKPADFRLESLPVPTPGKGEILVRVIWLSLDPYMRGRMDDAKSYADPVPLGGVMEGGTVAEVIASDHPKWQVGDIVEGRFGWQSHAISDGAMLRRLDPAQAPVSTALGVLGMPGITAYVGLNDHGRPKAGETLVVSAATGAVGSLVGQLGKAYGLRVVGVAGGARKCAFAVQELGFDACIDHRAAADASAMRKELAKECPAGVDIYFENVGGKTLEAVLPLMNPLGRIPVCGMISWYNEGALGAGAASTMSMPALWRSILVKRLAVRGFIITDHYDRFPAFLAEVSGHLASGKVTYRETIAEGLEAAPEAFIAMLGGGNFGKQLVRVSPDPTRG